MNPFPAPLIREGRLLHYGAVLPLQPGESALQFPPEILRTWRWQSEKSWALVGLSWTVILGLYTLPYGLAAAPIAYELWERHREQSWFQALAKARCAWLICRSSRFLGGCVTPDPAGGGPHRRHMRSDRFRDEDFVSTDGVHLKPQLESLPGSDWGDAPTRVFRLYIGVVEGAPDIPLADPVVEPREGHDAARARFEEQLAEVRARGQLVAEVLGVAFREGF